MGKKLVLPLTGLLVCIALLLVACGQVLSQGMSDMHSIRSAGLTPASSYEEVQEQLPNG